MAQRKISGKKFVLNTATNNRFLILLSIFITLIGFLTGYHAKNFAWFSRSGAVIVAVGIVLVSRANLIGVPLKIDVEMETGFNETDPRHYQATGEPTPEWVLENERSKFAIGVIGPLVSSAGTIINGYGDLLNRLFGFS